MKLVKVLIPFTDKVTGTTYKVNDALELSDERIAEIKAVNTNMIEVSREDVAATEEGIEETTEDAVEDVTEDAVEDVTEDAVTKETTKKAGKKASKKDAE